MIRVLHVIGAMDRGGAETVVMNLYRAIDRSRIQFDFMVHEQRTCDYDEEILSLGGAIYRAPRFSGLNAAAYRKVFREHFAAHPEHRIVHGHIGSSAAWYLSEAVRAGRYAIAHSHAQNFAKGLAGLAFSVASHPTRSIADYFMACSIEAGRDRFGDAVVRSDRFRVLRNGIDLSRYAFDEAARSSTRAQLGFGSEPVIGHVGRLSPEKNHAFLFDTFEALRKRVPDARLALVGRGPLADDLAADARDRGWTGAGSPECVTFLGVRDDVPDLLRAFDAFAFPSPSEGLAMAVVEAQAAGLPCVISTGVPELACIAPTAARLALSDGPDAWAARLEELVRSAPPSRRGDGVAAVRAAGFDIADVASDLAAFYEEHA